jgi:hypothetical protein
MKKYVYRASCLEKGAVEKEPWLTVCSIFSQIGIILLLRATQPNNLLKDKRGLPRLQRGRKEGRAPGG